MILRLIGPNDEFTVDYWMEEEAPSVVYNDKRVWVRSANSTSDNPMYFEQRSARYIPESFLRPASSTKK